MKEENQDKQQKILEKTENPSEQRYSIKNSKSTFNSVPANTSEAIITST